MALKRMGAPDKFKVIKEKWVAQGKLPIFSGGIEILLSLVVLPGGFAGTADVLPLVPWFILLTRTNTGVLWCEGWNAALLKVRGLFPPIGRMFPSLFHCHGCSFEGIHSKAGQETLCGQEQGHVVV